LEFLKRADEIEVVDAPAQASLLRLRELALLVAAEVVESELRAYLHSHHIEEIWGTQERILVGITPRTDAKPILESGRRNADRFHGELFVAYVRQPNLSAADQAALDRNLAMARAADATIKVLNADRDPARALITFAREMGITQIFIGHSLRTDWRYRLLGNPVERLIDLAEGIDVRVFPQRPSA
jgi:two-component system sensor histidine kinase KdpD